MPGRAAVARATKNVIVVRDCCVYISKCKYGNFSRGVPLAALAMIPRQVRDNRHPVGAVKGVHRRGRHGGIVNRRDANQEITISWPR